VGPRGDRNRQVLLYDLIKQVATIGRSLFMSAAILATHYTQNGYQTRPCMHAHID